MDDVCTSTDNNTNGNQQELTTVICGFDCSSLAPRREEERNDLRIPAEEEEDNDDLSLPKSVEKSSSPVNVEGVENFNDSKNDDQFNENYKSDENMTLGEEDSPSSKKEKSSMHVQEVECLKEQLTFLTHQVLQLMHVLCINHCRCSSCNAFIDLAKFSQIFPSTNRLVNSVQNGLLQEQVGNHDESQSFEGEDAILEDDEDDTSIRFSFGSKGGLKSKNANQYCDTNINVEHEDRNKSLDLQEKDISDENGSPQNRPNTSLDEETSSNDNGVENFSPNDNALFNLCHSGIINSALIRNRRLIVGVDQLLPKLLAEQRDHSSSGPLTLSNGNMEKYRQEENKSPTMEAENLTCRSRRRHFSPRTMAAGFGHGSVGGESRSLASAEVSSSTNYHNHNNTNAAVAAVNDHQVLPTTAANQALNLADLLAATANDARNASSRKRRRYLEDSDQNHAALHCIDNAGERACFVNESPNSSGGSLELPKTSLETSRYLTALGPALSTGLPLVMPGPKTTTFFCTICNREFSNVYYKRHMIVHANSRPYVCDVCGKRFNERSNMMKHKQRLHESEEYQFKVSIVQ
uniref:C2H2-type domain-containing protein n=1 Tax=Romanomermis culicivorax TaxID=13658 RepID=A0A915J0S4_ROMCU